MAPRLRRVLRVTVISLAGILVVAAAGIAYGAHGTEEEIDSNRRRVEVSAGVAAAPQWERNALKGLPAPVVRYFEYSFPSAPTQPPLVTMEMSGEFRRPNAENFTRTTAQEVAAIGTPAMVFSATSHVAPGFWARVYDAYVEGHMTMKAKVLSAITVVNEKQTPKLDQISLQRWLMESPVYPAALLPGGAVRWEAIDDHRARAVATSGGVQAAVVATFRPNGSLQSLEVEQDGDLTTSYHGSGEFTVRDDYRLVSGMMIPHSFETSRRAGGKIYPFWRGHLTSVTYRTGS
jgi:hypothetical protein